MPQLTPQQALDMARRHKNAGEFSQAADICRQLLQHQPDHPDATYLLGLIYLDTRQFPAAIDLFSKCTQIAPDSQHARYSLGLSLARSGRDHEAIPNFQKAIQLQNDFPEAITSLGAALMRTGRFDDALVYLKRAAQLSPNRFESHNNLGIALAEKGLFDQAAAALSRSLELKPNSPVTIRNLAQVLAKQHREHDAIAAYRRAIELDPACIAAYCDLGVTLVAAGQVDEGIACFAKAIALDPDFASAHYFHAMALLLQGDFARGLPEYEWRWSAREFPSPRRHFVEPQWDGQDLSGKTILLHCEQGFGDSIQFIRYCSLVAQRGAKICLECPPELIRLFANAPGVTNICPAGQPLPPFDLHCPIMSLPARFNTNLLMMPATVPYLNPDKLLMNHWRLRLGDAVGKFRVGLAWAGRLDFSGDSTRSLQLSKLAPLAAVAGIRFYTLQKGLPAEQANQPPAGMDLVNLSAELNDFADTAAVISLMDLIITTDTSVPHLAGAVGKPTWIMLQFVSDWRWFLDRSDSPWYPTMRLFRQPNLGDWNSVIQNVVSALEEKVGMHSANCREQQDRTK